MRYTVWEELAILQEINLSTPRAPYRALGLKHSHQPRAFHESPSKSIYAPLPAYTFSVFLARASTTQNVPTVPTVPVLKDDATSAYARGHGGEKNNFCFRLIQPTAGYRGAPV